MTTQLEVVVLRHYKESWRASNSGRLAHLALTNSRIVEHGGQLAPVTETPWPEEGTWLVFPDAEPRSAPPVPPPGRIVILDATWQQARRMRRRVPWLRGLPVLSLPPVEVSSHRMRRSPGLGMVSTIEAIAGAIRFLESPVVADELERLFALATDRAYALGRKAPWDDAD